jgi:DNA-binding MarR family transcriptional regulator
MTTRAVRLDRHRELWSRYSSNLPRHLIGLARHLQAETLRALEDRGYRGLRLSFEPYIALVGESGCRLRDLAEALGISKQACNQAADEIEQAGYLARVDDPEDRRGKRLVLTARGRALLRDGRKAAQQVQADCATRIGKARLARLARLCARLDGGLGLASPAGDSAAPPGAELARLLPRLSRYLMQSLMDRTRARGHAGLKLSHGQVLSLIGPTGGRMQQMARIQQVSKQAIGAVARDLEGLGYIGRSADPDDARQVVLALTPRGVRLLEDSISAVDELGAEFAARLGTAELTELESLARALYLALGLEQEVFATPDELLRLARNLRQQLGERGAQALAELLRNPLEDLVA